MSLDFVKALKAPANVDNWIVKLLIGGILLCIPIANFIVLGYLTKIVKNGMNGQERLPDYSDLGGLFVTGAKLLVGCLIFSLPFATVIFLLSMILAKSAVLLSILVFLVQMVAAVLALPLIASFAVDEKIMSMLDFPRMMKFLQDNTSGFVALIGFAILIYAIYTIITMVSCMVVVLVILIPFYMYAMTVSVYSLIGQFAKNAPKLEEIKAEG